MTDDKHYSERLQEEEYKPTPTKIMLLVVIGSIAAISIGFGLMIYFS